MPLMAAATVLEALKEQGTIRAEYKGLRVLGLAAMRFSIFQEK